MGEGVCESIDAKCCCCSARCLGPVYEIHGYEDADPVKCHFVKVSDVNFIMAEVTHIGRYGCWICRWKHPGKGRRRSLFQSAIEYWDGIRYWPTYWRAAVPASSNRIGSESLLSSVAFCKSTMTVLVSSNEKSWMHQNTQGNSKTFCSSNFLFFSADFSLVLDYRWNKTSYWQHEWTSRRRQSWY